MYTEKITLPSLDVKELAENLGLPYHSLRREFIRVHGMGPSIYFLELKIREARRRLAAGDEAARKIGARLGFEDAYYFSRIFKKRTGLSPLEYRQSFRGHR
ncbi:MAG: helix-turn-helix transcriptional regulator [Spirochaetia bacterium]|nr:helix-turn-helix transcriptional regulator [Spirochaetia bacterium]